ncbi:hypothetical protein [Nocardioides sp. T2.26MG-1]|uniref:hypothetical protein n=1 Tax=Nocardioides sp. T2.26MG-1 TaxID=3041166 RepID=UPI0024779F32|nr:hypothetical protein [Nocardioides sp. T2.26MG-1]CAI9407360.1 hypothetical protein HIDPHFAB_04768 [Nocardioides sp. T2.26MG-1]
MESEEIRRALHEADRAEAAAWTDYPPTPRWYPPATGLWAAGLTLVFGGLDGSARALALLALVVVEVGFIRWYTGYRGGMWPTGRPPREFRPAIAWLLGALAVVVAAALASATVSLGAAALLVAVAVTLLVARYERAYADAARRARERLS